MACFHPLKAFYRLEPGTRKKDIVFANQAEIDQGFAIRDNKHYLNPIDIPCGQCSGCRLEYSRQWATRCVLEAQKYEHNYFVTLTYHPHYEYLITQHNSCVVEDTGEFLEWDSLTLVPDQLKKFMKDLRRYYEYHFNHTGIRFFACGEYGSKKMRPHFHLILFNCPIPDLKYECMNYNGDSYFSSQIFNKLWSVNNDPKNPIGFVTIGECNFDTCSYVARYMMKKQKGLNSSYYSDLGLVPPFTRSSRMPGIARDYYDSERDKIYDLDSLVITDGSGKARKVRPPKYFDRLYDIECPEDFDRIKAKRSESAENSLRQKLERTDHDKDSYLAVCERNFENRVIKLLRSLD